MTKYGLLKLTQNEIPKYFEIGKKKCPCVLYGIHDNAFVWICNEEKCNYDYIQKNNIPHIKINGTGSTIVCSKGDIDFGFFGDKQFCVEMFSRVSNKLSEMITNSEFINNDFMYNGCKHGAATCIDFGDVYYVGIHLSNSVSTELIKRICQKKCYKKPSRLPVPFTEKDVLELFSDGEVL